MSRSGRPQFALSRAALLGAAALALLAPAGAMARVGVTSVTDGDPLGKPPAESERILRIGIDIQANELITTSDNDRAHLVFLDGTSLTVGPNARLVIDKFVFDPASKTGDLAINASKGVFRLVGGKISKTQPITVTTPSSTIGIRGGITILDVQPTQTTSTFVFGDKMTVTGLGLTQTATRPGSQITANSGAPPTPPTLVGQGGLNGQLSQLEGKSGGNSGTRTPAPAATVIVSGTQNLASQQPIPVSASTSITPAFASPQQWNPATNFSPATLDPATYAAGSNPAGLPNTGSATYNGTFSGSDSRSGSFGGSLSIGWSFASQTGTLNASGQGGGSATANLALQQGTANFSGHLTVTNILGGNSGTGSVSGSFSSANQLGGTFSGNSTNTYNPSTFSGSFSAHK